VWSVSCREAVAPAVRVSDVDLVDLSSRPLGDLVELARDILYRFKFFEGKCFSAVPRELYDVYIGMFHLALLKLGIALEERASGRLEGDLAEIVGMYTVDERKAVREFERFSKLDPSVTPASVLADIIIARRGEIYGLVREAMAKQYVDLQGLVKTWAREGRVRDAIARALVSRYEARFRNVVEAVKMLIDRQPAWILRLFTEYEEALLESSQVRERFEKVYREVFEAEARRLEERIRQLEEEKVRLAKMVETLAAKATEEERARLEAEEEAAKLRRSYEEVRARYEQLMRDYESKLGELEKLKGELQAKEKALMDVLEREKANVAAREALEAELYRLKSLVAEYEERVRGYEGLKERLTLELESLRERVESLERAQRGEARGHLVYSDEASLLELIFINKFRSKLEALPLKLKTPWGDEEVKVWDEWRIESGALEREPLAPRNSSIVFIARKRGFLGFGEERYVEVRGVYYAHLDRLGKLGFDDRPATLAELLSIITKVYSGVQKSGRRLVILGVSSPTGWEEKAIKYVRGEAAGSLVFRDLAVILVDQFRGEVYYYDTPWVEYYASLFKPEISEDEERRVEDTIKALCEEAYAISPEAPAFPESKIFERVKPSPDTLSAMRVLRRLSEKGVLEVKRVGGERVIICRRVT